MKQRDKKGKFEKGNKINLGRKRKPFSEEWRKNMGKSKEGKPLSENHCKKISKTRKRLFKEGKLKPSSSCFEKGHNVPREWRDKLRLNDEQKVKSIEKRKVYKKEFYQSPKAKAYFAKWREKYPEKTKAHNMANYYLKDLKSPGTQMHHPNYNEPLSVVVMPIAEHRQLHIQLKQMGVPS